MSTVDFQPSAAVDEPEATAYADAGVSFLRSAVASLAAQVTEPQAAAALRFSLRAVDGLDHDALREVALGPAYRFWQTSLGSAARSGARRPVERLARDLPRILLAAVLKARMDVDVETVAADGELRFPGLPRRLCLGAEMADVPVSLSRKGDQLRVRHGDRAREMSADEFVHGGPRLIEHARLPGSDVELDASGAVVREWFAAHNAIVSSPLHPRRDIAPSIRAAGEYRQFDAAARLIREAWPECFAELSRQVRLVVPFTSKLMAGWTSQDRLGAVFVRDLAPTDCAVADADDFADQVAYTADRLVHESAHTRLYHLSFGHRLFADADAARRLLRSPLRKDMRPAIGVLHAAFVLGRVSVFMHRAAELTSQERYRARAARAAADFAAGRDVLIDAAVLNPTGSRLLDQITGELERSAMQQAVEVTQ